MKRAVLATFAAFAALLPTLGFASTLDDQLGCGVSAHDFVGSLVQQQLIDPKPMRVENNSINAFWPTSGVDLKAFGFRVFAIVGFEKGDPMFRPGNGAPIANSAYGAVVFGGTDKVQAEVNAAHSTAVVHHVAPHVTAIFCKRS